MAPPGLADHARNLSWGDGAYANFAGTTAFAGGSDSASGAINGMTTGPQSLLDTWPASNTPTSTTNAAWDQHGAWGAPSSDVLAAAQSAPDPFSAAMAIVKAYSGSPTMGNGSRNGSSGTASDPATAITAVTGAVGSAVQNVGSAIGGAGSAIGGTLGGIGSALTDPNAAPAAALNAAAGASASAGAATGDGVRAILSGNFANATVQTVVFGILAIVLIGLGVWSLFGKPIPVPV